MKFKVIKTQIFNKAVKDHLAPKVRRVLTRFGAYARRTMQKSVRRKGSKTTPHSKPGDPPFSPTGKLRKSIEFHFDKKEQSVIVGPVKFNQIFFNGHGEPVRGTVPKVLEEGGEIHILEVFTLMPVGSEKRRNQSTGRFEKSKAKFEKQWVRADLRSKRRNAGKPTRLRKVKIAARPYAEPALDKHLPDLRKWKAE